MRIGTGIEADKPIDEVVRQAVAARDAGFAHVWGSQIFGADTLTVFATVAHQVDGIAFGTAVVPIQPRHPQVLAQQALTVQAISGGRLLLGIGLSHQVVVEQMWGLSYAKPATYMREYLDALLPMLAGENVSVKGELVSATTFQRVGPRGAAAPPVLLAALGPVMLKLAGARADGTATWMVGTQTLRDYIVPTILQAAEEAGRDAPRIVASVPICLTNDVAGAAERINTELALYPTLPSYKAMLDREGASGAADVSLLGSRSVIEDGVAALAAAGVTDLSAAPMGTSEEQAATYTLMAELARG